MWQRVHEGCGSRFSRVGALWIGEQPDDLRHGRLEGSAVRAVG